MSSEKLVATAAGLVAERGPDAVHLSHVAQACGVAVGTLYNHFSSKEQLMLAVTGVAEDIVVAAMEHAAPVDRALRPALPGLTAALLEVATGAPLVRVLLRSSAPGATAGADEAPRIRAWIAARVGAAQAAGEVGPADVDVVAGLAYGLVRAGLPLTAARQDEVAERLAGGLAGLLPPP